MSSNKIVPVICVLTVIGAPFLAANRSVSISNNISEKTVVNKEFTVKVNSLSQSKNGFITCSYYVNEISKVLMGPCVTTGDMVLSVGRTYTVTKAVVDAEFIVINDAKLIGGMVRKQVVKVFNKGWTKLAKLDNGDVIGGENVRVGDWISVD